MGTEDLWRVSQSSGKPWDSQAKFRVGTVRGLKKSHVGTGPVWSVFGENPFYLENRVGDEGGGRHVAKSRSVPRVANPEVKVQVRDLVRAVGIGSPFATRGVGTREKFVLWSPRGQMGIGDLFRVPQAAVWHERARQSSETGPCGDCRRSCWYCTRAVRIRAKFVLSRNLW